VSGGGGQGLAASGSQGRAFRTSRSLMDLVADAGGSRPPTRPDAVPAKQLPELMRRLATTLVAAARSEQCTICLMAPEKGEALTYLPCGHWYHRDCIREWLGHSRLCPLCKGSAIPANVKVEED